MGVRQLFAALELGETLDASAKAYDAVFGSLTEDKRIVIDQILRAFTCAQGAYSAIFKYRNDTRTDKQRICEVAGHAIQYFVHVANLRRIYQCGDERVLEIMDSTSAWLKGKGWYGLPVPSGEDGVKIAKNAKGVYDDMKQYVNAYGILMSECRMLEVQGARRR